MKDQRAERWRFVVKSPGADRVFLVHTCGEGTSTWSEMVPFGRSLFQLERSIGPGPHRFSYVVGEGSTYINCGPNGLDCQRITEEEAATEHAPVHAAIPA